MTSRGPRPSGAATVDPGSTRVPARIPTRGEHAVRRAMQDLAPRFRPEIAGDLVATWVVEVTDPATEVRQDWAVHVSGGTCHVAAATDRTNAVAHLRTDPQTWVDLADGRIDGIRAFLAGRLEIRGDLNLALRLETLFRPGPDARTPLEVRRSRVKGSTIESVVTGTGRPVVLVHGLAAHKVSFVPTLVGLADAGYQVHAIDLPGFGKSDKPLPAGRRYSMSWMADHVNGYLIRHNLRDAIIVGNSMGGRIATEVALRNPRAVRAIAGLGPAVAFDEWQRFGPALARSQFHWAAAAPPPVRAEWISSVIRQLLFQDPNRLPSDNFLAAAEDIISYIRDPRYRMATAACARNLIREKAEGRKGYWERLSGLTVPSLWIWGRQDQLVSSRYAERVRSTVPGARVEVWDGVGHVPQFEVPGRTNEALLDFLSTV